MVFHVTYVSGYMRCLEEFLGVTAVAETTHLFVDKLLSIKLFANFFFVISHDESMSPDDKVTLRAMGILTIFDESLGNIFSAQILAACHSHPFL